MKRSRALKRPRNHKGADMAFAGPQTKFGRLFLKKTGSVEEVLVELTEEQLIVRSHDRRAPPIEETPIQEEMNVKLKKDRNGSIGLILKGGAEWKTAVSVSDVQKGSAAHQSGQVHPGDEILAVNGTDVSRMTLEEVADVIVNCGEVLTLHLARSGQEIHDTNAKIEDIDLKDIATIKDVLLEQGPDGLGITLKGGADVKSPLRIDFLTLKGAAHRCGQVCHGDIILAVNEMDVTSKTIADVKTLIRNSGRYVTLKLGKMSSPDTFTAGDSEAMVQKTVDVVLGPSGLGISINGGADVGAPVKVSHVEQNSPADATGQIHRGDVIVSMNGVDLKDRTQEDVVEILKEAGSNVTLVLATPVAKRAQRPSKHPQTDKELLVICSIPLCLAYVTQYEPGVDKLKVNGFEVVSCDGGSSIELFGSQGSGQEVASWLEAIQSNIRCLNQQEAQRMSDAICLDDAISHVSWVVERLPSTRHLHTWTRKFLVLRSASLDIYHQPPETIQEGCRPECTLQLAEFTVETLKGRSQPNLRSHALQLQSGRGQCIILAFENAFDLNMWKEAIHRAKVEYVVKKKLLQFKTQWNGYDALFVMDIRRGLMIVDPLTKSVLWQRPFSHLAGSADNHVDMLKLTFASSGQQRQETQVMKLTNLLLAVCALEAFLAAKVAQTDPAFAVQHN